MMNKGPPLWLLLLIILACVAAGIIILAILVMCFKMYRRRKRLTMDRMRLTNKAEGNPYSLSPVGQDGASSGFVNPTCTTVVETGSSNFGVMEQAQCVPNGTSMADSDNRLSVYENVAFGGSATLVVEPSAGAHGDNTETNNNLGHGSQPASPGRTVLYLHPPRLEDTMANTCSGNEDGYEHSYSMVGSHEQTTPTEEQQQEGVIHLNLDGEDLYEHSYSTLPGEPEEDSNPPVCCTSKPSSAVGNIQTCASERLEHLPIRLSNNSFPGPQEYNLESDRPMSVSTLYDDTRNMPTPPGDNSQDEVGLYASVSNEDPYDYAYWAVPIRGEKDELSDIRGISVEPQMGRFESAHVFGCQISDVSSSPQGNHTFEPEEAYMDHDSGELTGQTEEVRLSKGSHGPRIHLSVDDYYEPFSDVQDRVSPAKNLDSQNAENCKDDDSFVRIELNASQDSEFSHTYDVPSEYFSKVGEHGGFYNLQCHMSDVVPASPVPSDDSYETFDALPPTLGTDTAHAEHEGKETSLPVIPCHHGAPLPNMPKKKDIEPQARPRPIPAPRKSKQNKESIQKRPTMVRDISEDDYDDILPNQEEYQTIDDLDEKVQRSSVGDGDIMGDFEHWYTDPDDTPGKKHLCPSGESNMEGTLEDEYEVVEDGHIYDTPEAEDASSDVSGYDVPADLNLCDDEIQQFPDEDDPHARRGSESTHGSSPIIWTSSAIYADTEDAAAFEEDDSIYANLPFAATRRHFTEEANGSLYANLPLHNPVDHSYRFSCRDSGIYEEIGAGSCISQGTVESDEPMDTSHDRSHFSRSKFQDSPQCGVGKAAIVMTPSQYGKPQGVRDRKESDEYLTMSHGEQVDLARADQSLYLPMSPSTPAEAIYENKPTLRPVAGRQNQQDSKYYESIDIESMSIYHPVEESEA